MASLVKTARAAALPPAMLLVPPLAVLVNLFFFDSLYVLLCGATPETDYLPLHNGLLAALAAVAFAACAMRTLGWSRSGSAAGLSLAAFSLAGSDILECMLRVGGLEATIYDEVPRLATLVWVSRNLTLVAYGYGLGLVVFSTLVDALRRRRDPAWVADPV